MNTLPSLASKGEKGKSKYQSLDINSLYRSSRGESLETHQQKNTLPRKHGMQSLGKVPSARRPPANLPSLKSEHSGSDAAVSLVPSGGPGWGKQDSTSSSTTTSPTTSNVVSSTDSAPIVTTTQQQTPPVQPATSPNKQQQTAPQHVQQPSQTAVPAQPCPVPIAPLVTGSDKSWSAVMSGSDILAQHPPPYQSPQFQHEFPSLAGDTASSGGSVAGSRGGCDVQYGPGPSLRPQTEGSWIQGGSRTASASTDQVQTGVKGNSGQLAGPPQLLGPAGPIPIASPNSPTVAPHQNVLQQFRGVVPTFMFRGNFSTNGHGVSNFSSMTNPLAGRSNRPPVPGTTTPVGQFPHGEVRTVIGRTPTTQVSNETEEVTPRPIIKEEDLNRMDDMTRDVGWASHDDIDYNQKLAFSDDEGNVERETRKEQRKEMERMEINVTASEIRNTGANSSGVAPNRGWGSNRSSSGNPQSATPQTNRAQGARSVDEEEVWNQRREQQKEVVAIAVERAKLRKQEEEKRYLELKQAAQKKLLELEEKIKEKKGTDVKEIEESQGTINPSTVPPQPITPVPIPVPEWERDRETRERERSRTPNDNLENKSHSVHRDPDFRQTTQIEARSFNKNNPRSNDREISRERDVRRDDREIRDREGPFSRQFQSNLPPRFQKQQAERSANAYHRGNNNGSSGNSSSPQPQQTTSSSNISFAQQYDPRWVQTNSTFPGKNSSGTTRPKNRSETESSFERDRDDERRDRDMRRDRHTPDESGRHSFDRSYSDSGRKSGSESRYHDDYRNYKRENSQEYEFKRDNHDDKWEKDRERHEENRKSAVQLDPFDEHDINRSEPGDWHRDKYSKDNWEERQQEKLREDISQRPESRDSRISKESTRDSDYSGNWADSPFEPPFTEEKKKESYREERRQVPGPITKEKIEADDIKNEKRQLTQLKRSSLNENKNEKKSGDKSDKKGDDPWSLRKKDPIIERADSITSSKAWTDTGSINSSSENSKFMEALEKNNKKLLNTDKSDSKDIKKTEKENIDKDDKHTQGGLSRGRSDPSRNNHRSNQWGGGFAVYHGSAWSKRSAEPRRGSQRVSSQRSRDWHATDSELSADEISISTESGKEDRSLRHAPQRNSNAVKKSEKDEKNKDLKQDKTDRLKYDKRSYDQTSRNNRENFVPRGEPSRHGRGGFRGPRSVTSKRIDGYGIPPSKSPFGNQLDEKDKKLSEDEIGGEVISSDEKTKITQQQALSAGIIGSSRNQLKSDNQTRSQKKDDKRDNSKNRTHSGSRRQKTKQKLISSDPGEENWETTSENSDTESERKTDRKRSVGRNNTIAFSLGGAPRQTSNNINPVINRSAPIRNPGEKRTSGLYSVRNDQHSSSRQSSNSNLRSNQLLKNKDNAEIKDETKNDSSTIEKSLNKEKVELNENNQIELILDDKNVTHFDADGFQEVRSKKNVKERQKGDEKVSSRIKMEKETGRGREKAKGSSPASQLTPQQIANIPPLLGTPVNPPNMMNPGNNKMSFERPRQNKLPPRLAKQRENHRLQKAQMQQGICDVSDMNKINQTVTMYSLKDNSAPAPVPVLNAWEKPITSQLRSSVEQDTLLTMGVDNCADLEQTQPSSTSSQRSSPSNDKVIGKSNVVGQDKAVLDGTTPPVNTIIFENTNYKSVPVPTDLAVKSKFSTHLKTQSRTDKPRNSKIVDENDVESSVIGFNKPISDILNKNESKPDPIQMPLSFNKAEDNGDMKLDFTFDSDLSQLTEDKSSKSLGLSRSIHAISSTQSTTISPSTNELDFKIASVRKVWETMPTVLEQEDNVTSSAGTFSTSFGPDPNSLDHSNAFSKGTDTPDDNHEGYSPSPSQSCTSNNTTNVCKVKPTQQLAGSGQTVHSVTTHHTASQQHPGAASANQQSPIVGQNIIGHPLSPPPMQQMLGASVGLGQPPQQYTSNQHINYQPSLGGSAQYGSMSAIPSPPTVLFNSTQQMPTQGGLYGPFQIDQSQVLNTQGRSQFSQYPNPYGLGQTASSPYSAQSMYLQTAPPHPPPSAQPPPDIYQSLSSQYRMTAGGPFGQSQQLTNNPSTVLISSTSNSHSLMSATVKPSSQQISAIGTKAGAVGQAYQQQSQQGQQLYIPYDPNMQANYLSGTGVLQRGPTGPVQNSVVPGLQPSSSYYSGSAGAQTGYYQQPGNSTIQSAPLHQHQASFGLQGNVFGTHNQSHANAAGLQSFGSQFLSSPMQMAAAAALTAQQQFRSPSLPNPNYLKGVGTQHITDQNTRSQQLKSPGTNQQDVLASVFNSVPQIPSPKSRQNCKQPPPQSSPTQHKYISAYQSVNNQQSAQIPPTRYPAPIQRPVNFQPSLNSTIQNASNVSNRHRPSHSQNSRGPPRQYYGGQGAGMSASQSEKSEDSKLNENGPSSAISATSSVNKVSASAGAQGTTNQNSELEKKDETIVNKE